jgi:hypothetical protein
MSFASLLIHTVTVLNPTTGAPNRYGDPSLVYDDGVEVPARVAQLGSEEDVNQRDERTTRFRVYLHPDVAIDALSLVEWNGKMYKVSGEPTVRDGRWGPHHIEAEIELVEGG